MQDGGADYAEFQDFLRKFQTTIDPEDQLPIRVSNYTITRDEFKPEVVNFARQYLQEKWSTEVERLKVAIDVEHNGGSQMRRRPSSAEDHSIESAVD